MHTSRTNMWIGIYFIDLNPSSKKAEVSPSVFNPRNFEDFPQVVGVWIGLQLGVFFQI